MEKKNIGAFLAVLRKANGMTQQQVADRLNVSNKTVSKWERDESLPDLTLIPALAEMFHVTADEILRGQRMDQAGQTETVQEKQAEKTHSQARTIIARTMGRHLNWTAGAAAILAAGMIALFTMSYAFFKPALGFGIFMILMLAGLMTAFLATNTARTALTGGEIINETDALSAEQRLLSRIKKLISAAAVALVWALPLILVRSEVFTDSVIKWETYLSLSPMLSAVSVLVWLLSESICMKIWPELRENYERTDRKLKRLYAAAGCVLALILMASAMGLINANSAVVTESQQTIRVQFDDAAAYREYVEIAEDCALGGAAWMDYCEKNLAERGIPWKGEISDVDRDYLTEFGYLPELTEELDAGFYFWAFCPGMQSVEGLEVWFEMTNYRSGDSEAAFGILMLTVPMLAVLGAIVFLRRRYILRAEKEHRLQEHAPAEIREAESEAEEKEE